MVKQLIYKSQSVTMITPELIEDVLFAAARFNEQHDITGILLYSEDVFLQLIEGAPADIDELHNRILADERHRNVQTVYLGYAEERSYPDWRMRAYTSDQSPLHMLNEAQRVFIRCADPLGSELDFETTWIGSFMRSMCRDHLPVGAPDPSKFN